MATNVLIYIPSNGGGFTDPVSGEFYKPGDIAGFDSTVSAQLAEANRIISAQAGLDVSELVTALIQIAWANITGKPSSFTPSAHTHTASEIVSGILDIARIPDLDASKLVTGVLSALRIPDLDAAKIATGILSAARIPDLDAAKIVTGVLALSLIPDLPASKITSGEFADARIAQSSVTQHQGALSLGLSQVSDAGALAGKDTIATADIDAEAVTEDKLSASVAEKLNRSAKNNFNATTNPGVTNDASEGYSEGSKWVNRTADESFVCLDATEGAALWANTSLTADDLGSLAFQEASNVTITGGVITVTSATIGGVEISGGNVDGRDVSADGAKLDGIEAGAKGDMTGAEIKAAYEGEADTNAFADADKSKLDGIEAGATANATNAQLRDRSTHTGTQPQSSIDDLESDLADRLLRSELPYASLVHYSSTDDATDMAAGATVQWDSALMTDSGISVGGVNNTNITVSEAGKYVVSVRLVYADTSAEGVDVNNTLGVSILVNGVSVGRQGVGSPVVNADGANEGQAIISEPLDLEPGDVVTVTTQRLSGGDELYLIAGQSSLIVERKGGKSAALAAQRFRELSDTPNDYTDEGAILRVKTGGGIEYTLTIPQSAVADLVTTLSNKADLVGGKVPTAQIPALALTKPFPVADIAARDALDVQEGDVAIVASDGKSYIYDGSAWLELSSAAPVTSINGQTGVVVLSKADIGLGNVDNTSDADKPISTAQAAVNASLAAAIESAGGGLQVQPVQTSGFTPALGNAYPVDLRSGAITLTGLPASPEQGDRVELYDVYRAASGTNTLTIPADAPLNGVAVDLIVSQVGFRVVLEYVSASHGYDVLVLGVEDPDALRRATVSKPSITSPANGATDVDDLVTITGSAFGMDYQTGTHASTDWQRSQASDFSVIDLESLADASNLTSWTPASNTWTVSTEYYVRVRYRSANGEVSAWSDPVSFTTADAFSYTWTNTEGSAFEAQADTTGWDDALRGDIDQLISDLKSGQINSSNTYGGFDRILLMDLPNQSDSLRYLNAPTLTATAVNSPTFTATEGFTGDGSTAYIDTGYNPATDGSQYTQNSASMGVWVRGKGASGSHVFGVQTNLSTVAQVRLQSNASDGIAGSVNDSAAIGTAAGVYAAGLLGVNRSGATAEQIYKNGLSVATDTDSSKALPEDTVALLAYNALGARTSFSDAQLSIFLAGRSFTANEWADIYDAFNRYRTAREAV